MYVEICILIRLHYVHYCRDTTSDFIFHKLHRIFKLSGFTKFVQVRYLQDIVKMIVQVLKWLLFIHTDHGDTF